LAATSTTVVSVTEFVKPRFRFNTTRARETALGGTENYVVTREFRRISTPLQRAQLLECLYAVTAADGTISTAESREIANVAEELGFTRAEANALRTKYRDKLAEFQR
jgi:uncharacterized tellurite resistance protein B-like protein